jgi:capsid protein
MLQEGLIVGQFLRPAWRRWQELRALAGDIPLDRLGDHLPVRFVAPGFDWVDPGADVKADAMAVAQGFKSRREVVAARGRDLDELDEERAADPRKPQSEAAS